MRENNFRWNNLKKIIHYENPIKNIFHITIKNRDIFKFKETIRTLIIYLCHFFTQIKNTTNEKTINNLTFMVLVLPAIGVCDWDKKEMDLEERTGQSKLILVVAIILRRHRWMEMTKLGHEFGLVAIFWQLSFSIVARI